MKLALAPTGATGLRAGRAVLSDRRVVALGVLGADAHSRDTRVEVVENLEGWDALLTDADPDDSRVRDAIRLQVPIITPHTLSEFGDSGEAGVVAAASGRTGISAALAILLMEGFDSVRSIRAATTVEKRRVRRDKSALFPDPIGPLWCEEKATDVAHPKGLLFFEAPYDGPLQGVSVQAEGVVDGRGTIATEGIAEDPLFLAAVALAGAALMLLDKPHTNERIEVQQRAGAYLEACGSIGLSVASFKGAS